MTREQHIYLRNNTLPTDNKASEQVTVCRIEPWSEMVIKLFGHFNMISHWWLHEQNPVNPDNLAWFSFQTTGMMICQGIILMSAVIGHYSHVCGNRTRGGDHRSHFQGNSRYDTTNGHAKSTVVHIPNKALSLFC